MRDARRLPATSSTTGGDDALDHLEREHREVEGLFAKASLNVGSERLAVLPAIVEALTAHAEIEEEVVYPAIELAVGGGDVLTARSRADHDEITTLLAAVGAAKTDGPGLIDDLRALQFAVSAHVAIEEGELFPAYRAIATPDDLGELTAAADKARTAAGRDRS